MAVSFLAEELLPRPPIVFRPTFAHTFLVVSGHAKMHQVNLGSPGNAAEVQHQDRKIFLLPMRRPPELHNLFSWNDVKSLALQLLAECRELAA